MSTASNPPSQEPEGYRKLALLYGSVPECAVFKKFRVVHAHNLLLLSAEIINVDARFRSVCAAYRCATEPGDIPPDEYMFKLMTVSSGPESPYGLYKRRQELLEAYDTALLRHQAIERLPQVNPNNLAALGDWYEAPDGGKLFLHGMERKIWSDVADLTCLSRSDDAVDGVLLQIRDCVVSFLFRLFRDKSKKHELPLWEPVSMPKPLNTPLAWFPEQDITSILSITSTVLASILPALSIFALVFIQSLLVRVGIILLFTLTFSVVMAMLGKARRPEVWAVSAAFSAVLVVFVGGPNAPLTSGNLQ